MGSKKWKEPVSDKTWGNFKIVVGVCLLIMVVMAFCLSAQGSASAEQPEQPASPTPLAALEQYEQHKQPAASAALEQPAAFIQPEQDDQPCLDIPDENGELPVILLSPESMNMPEATEFVAQLSFHLNGREFHCDLAPRDEYFTLSVVPDDGDEAAICRAAVPAATDFLADCCFAEDGQCFLLPIDFLIVLEAAIAGAQANPTGCVLPGLCAAHP